MTELDMLRFYLKYAVHKRHGSDIALRLLNKEKPIHIYWDYQRVIDRFYEKNIDKYKI